jgi:hypothetical protein
LLPSGGTVVNSGSIDELVYDGGTYEGLTGSAVATWTIKSGTTTAETFGESSIGNLAFAADGTGLLRITNFADGSSDIAGKVTSVNLTAARIDVVVDSLDIIRSKGFSLLSLFGIDKEEVSGDLMSIASLAIFSAGDDGDWLEENIITNGIVNDDYFSGSGSGFDFIYNNDSGSAAPEPATLLIFGLGIAGLAAARRRKK